MATLLLDECVPQVDMANKTQDFIELYHSIIPDKDVRERVPVLVNGSHRLVDSHTIVEYISNAYPDSGTALTPSDPYTAARVRLFVQYFTVRTWYPEYALVR
jgi:glutathione S-transferase